MSINSLVEIVLYVLPGFLASEVYRAFYPVRERGQFPQLAWSIAIGVLLTATIVAIDEAWLGGILGASKSGFPNLGFLLALFGTGLALGGISAGQRRLRFRLSSRHPNLQWLTPDPQSIWIHVNRPANEDWAVVFLQDGAIYLGYIKYYRYDPNQSNQDFLLSFARRVDADLQTKYEITGQGVYLNTRDVLRIEFIRGRRKNNEPSAPSSP